MGYGYVGKAVGFGFKEMSKVWIYDKYLKLGSLEDVVKNADCIFVCVPTPMDPKYTGIDLSIVDNVVGEIVTIARKIGCEPIIVIKSTVVPGTTRNLVRKHKWRQMLFNPEFLTEANYLQDFVNADRIIVGGELQQVREKLVGLYREIFPKTLLFETDSMTAEMVKYMSNTYLATKVIFANEMYELCQKLGIKYEEVKKMTVADKRIFDSHLDVTSQRGFGGKCFPKDIVALLGLGRDLRVDMSLLSTVWKKNLRTRKTRDWEDIPGAVSNNKS